MAKRSRRRSVRYARDQSGCMWGFISLFDFRQGRSPRKLIVDKKHGSKHDVGSVHSKNKLEMLNNLDKDCQSTLENRKNNRLTVTTDAGKPSVKKLMEEEMFVDQDLGNAVVKSKESRYEHEDFGKRKKKSFSKSCDIDANDLHFDTTLKPNLSCSQHSRKQSKSDVDLNKVLEDFCRLKSTYSFMHECDGEVDKQSGQKCVIEEDNARDAAVLEFVNQMIFNGKDLAEARKFLCSDELMDALRILSSDKELFLGLLQNPNSLLLEYVEELIDNARRSDDKAHSSVTGSNLSEHDLSNPRQNRDFANHKQRNFFRKMVKSRTKNQISGNENNESSNRIVILKPGSMGLRNSEAETNLSHSLDSHEGPSMRLGSHFSLTEIKKKLRYAMGKEKDGNSGRILKDVPAECQQKRKGSKTIGKDNVGMKSPNKDHFFIEKIARPTFNGKKGDKTGSLKDSKVKVEHEDGTYPKQRFSNIYVEAKKNLCEMLGNEDENKNLSGGKDSKSLGRILSLPEYNLSPIGSPGRDWENQFVTAQTRFTGAEINKKTHEEISSPKQIACLNDLDQAMHSSEKHSNISEDCSNNKLQEIKSELDSSDGLIHDHNVEATSYSLRDEIVSEGNVELAEERNVSESCSELVGLIEENDQICDISEISHGHSQCLNQDVSEENQPPYSPESSSPSHSSINNKIEEPESGACVSGRPSPVSVLDTSFSEDDNSPGNNGSHFVKNQVQPLHLQFEEHETSPVDQIDRGKQCVEENKLIFDYIEAVLQASGFNRDQLWLKCVSSDKILDPSLSDQVEFFSDQLCYDQNLLFDCVNEILMEICRYFFGVSSWVSFVKHSNIRPTPTMKTIILKVWEGVCWHFLPLPPPRTLDQIVSKDMARSGTWMDLRFEAETIGTEMGEVILVELIEDSILSLLNENPEIECEKH